MDIGFEIGDTGDGGSTITPPMGGTKPPIGGGFTPTISAPTIIAQNDYFAFGLRHENPSYANSSSNRYLYNGKEEQTTGNVGLLDYGARTYDPRIARFTEIDRFAEKYFNHSPYSYVAGNPVKYIDINGDSIDVLQINLYDQSNGTNYLEQTTNDLSSQTGLSISMGANGNLEYAKDADGNPVISTDADGNQLGSATAREHMMGMMNGEETVKVWMQPGGSYVPHSGTDINLDPKQIEYFINGTVGVDNKTLGWGMTLMHETFHTNLGGGLKDHPNNNGTAPGPVVNQMNIIRSELNAQGGNYGQRGSYNAFQYSTSGAGYIPFSMRPIMHTIGGYQPSTPFVQFPPVSLY